MSNVDVSRENEGIMWAFQHFYSQKNHFFKTNSVLLGGGSPPKVTCTTDVNMQLKVDNKTDRSKVSLLQE